MSVKVVYFENGQPRVHLKSTAAAGGGPVLVYGPNNIAAWVSLKVVQPVDTLMGSALFNICDEVPRALHW